MTNNKSVGKQGETRAIDYLKNKGYLIRARNFLIRGGEVDIIATYQGVLVFVEVKTRSSNYFGSGVEALNYYKLKALEKSAQFYIAQINWGDRPYRFDAIIIDLSTGSLEHIENITQ